MSNTTGWLCLLFSLTLVGLLGCPPERGDDDAADDDAADDDVADDDTGDDDTGDDDTGDDDTGDDDTGDDDTGDDDTGDDDTGDDDTGDDDTADDDTGDDDTGDDDTGDDDTGDDDTTSTVYDTIYDIQTGVYASGDVVTVGGVVATSPMNTTNGLFVQDPAGGQYSGIYVYCATCSGGEASQGNELILTGSYSQYYGLDEISVTPADITVTGTVPVPAAEVVAACDIPAAGGGVAEEYESVLVRVENVEVTEEADGYGEWEVDSCTNVDDMFHAYTPSLGTDFSSITGPLNFAFGEFKIEPRDAGDLVVAWPAIYEMQTGVYTDGATVTVEDAVVTSPMTASGGFFVQDDMGGPYSGIYVFCAGCAGGEVSQGDEVTLVGTYTEYYDLSELQVDPADITVTGLGVLPTPEVVASCDLPAAGGGLAEEYEGVLVAVENVTVTTEADVYGEWVVDSCAKVDDVFHSNTPTLGDTFTRIAGPLTYAWSEYKIEPRDATDLVP